MLERVFETILQRRECPEAGSYTTYLFENGIDKILKKVMEECAETVIAAKNDDKNEQIYEIADLTYHLLVLLARLELSPGDIARELERREAKTGNLKDYRQFDVQ